MAARIINFRSCLNCSNTPWSGDMVQAKVVNKFLFLEVESRGTT